MKEYKASTGQILLFEECTSTRTDALPITVQGQHRRRGGVEPSGGRRETEEEGMHTVTGL